MSERSAPRGFVSLVGAGPGDPGLITMRGAERLRQADVVIYDRLAHPSLLDLARADAEKVYVGKTSAHHSMKQPDINALIVERALAGRRVCRLKGGDPFVFGRGGEEAEVCAEAGIPFEIVPGVTSAIAALAYAGIPITHRDASSSFAVITGHERDDSGEAGTRSAGESEQRRDWAKLSHAADTLAILMGVESLPEITAKLIQYGRSAETPAALVRWGTWTRQETLVSTVGQIADDARRAGFKAPAVFVVGDVVLQRELIRWFDNRPLFGKCVLITRAREQASALSDKLRELGAEPVEFPVIRIEPLDDYAELDSALQGLNNYDWVIFTSANGVRFVRERLSALKLDTRAFGKAKVACIGPGTAHTLSEMGICADFVPTEYVAERVLEEWPQADMAGVKVLLPRAEEARDVLPEGLQSRGASVDVIPSYRTLLDATAAEEIRQQLSGGSIDVLTFTSSSTVRNFVQSVGSDAVAAMPAAMRVVSIGPITSETARELGLRIDAEASEHTIDGLVESVVSLFDPREQRP